MLKHIHLGYAGAAIGFFISLFGQYAATHSWRAVSSLVIILASGFCGMIGMLYQRQVQARREEEEMMEFIRTKKEKGR